MFIFLAVLQAVIAALLVGVILVQKSEGGGLGVGGSPTGFMSARGAADFLTRSTAVLAAIFVGLSIVLAALAVKTSTGQSVDTSLNRAVVPVAPADPLGKAVQNGAVQNGSGQNSASVTQSTPVAPADPLGGAAKK